MTNLLAFLSKYWKEVLIVAFIALFALYFYQKGKNKGDNTNGWDFLNNVFGDKPEGITVVNPDTYQDCPEGYTGESLSNRLHSKMSGFNLGWNIAAAEWRELAELESDCAVGMVYNHFNLNHGNGKTLYEWIDDEFSYGSPWHTSALNRLRLAGLS